MLSQEYSPFMIQYLPIFEIPADPPLLCIYPIRHNNHGVMLIGKAVDSKQIFENNLLKHKLFFLIYLYSKR